MKLRIDAAWFSTPTAQLLLVGLLGTAMVGAVAWQRHHRRPAAVTAPQSKPAGLPRTLAREVARFVPLPSTDPIAPVEATAPAAPVPAPVKPAIPPLGLYTAKLEASQSAITAPYGRMIPCETVVTLESNRAETPLIGLVTEDVWQQGRLLVPAGAEVHGRARLDRERARLVADGSWTLCWQAPQPREIRIEAMVLARESDPHLDGTAGLDGKVLRSEDAREVKLFGATFLAAATSALQEHSTTVGVLGESSLPAATAGNATLAGTGAVLRDYAQQLRESIARDGFHLRVPAGKPFTLYVTQSLSIPVPHEN